MLVCCLCIDHGLRLLAIMLQIDEKEWFGGGHLGTQIQKTNWQVVNCTTPANYFHVLRRQVCVVRDVVMYVCCP